ncbi:MAG TPA: NAD-dependent succinate-semialdehyde dehydrogenase [Woeseiaceae bacterium]|nr:NAD-dependent succinate-semialdehyde dehydrogenase [Woeseiaceae bacterium]
MLNHTIENPTREWLDQIANRELVRTENFIGGKWQVSSSGKSFDITDPSTNAFLIQVTDSNADDARAAVDAASAAFPAWRATSARERAKLLKKWRSLLESNLEDLAMLMVREMGKPIVEARGEVAYGASYIEWFAEEAVRAAGDLAPLIIPGNRQMAVKEPVGVIAAISPWNFPLAMIARKIAPALAAGCTVVAKPAEDTPLTALALVKLIEEAGFPPGVVNIISTSRDNVADAVDVWLKDSRVRKITFTGSTAVGKHLARESANTLKKLTLELGGNAPFIVFEDADVDAAVEGLMKAKFRNGGQTCISPNRVYVHNDVYDEFAEKITARVESLRVGPAVDETTNIGPMINLRAIEKIHRHVSDALRNGATLLTGGDRLQNDVADGPNYFQPTVLGNGSPAMTLSCEETFGPIIALFRFDSEKEVIEAANDTPFGLAAYFYSSDVKRIWRVGAALESGVVGVNQGAVASEVMPFGGIKESGYGREGSRFGLDEYMHIKYLCQGELA